MWYIADATPGAQLYVGLKRGVTRSEFEQRIHSGTVADCFHRVDVRAGDAMFLPSGRVHAVGAGLLIFEIQQNSDTTYRVFDWNRVGLDGKPRALHIAESLASIDFDDFEPKLVEPKTLETGNLTSRRLVDVPLFRVDALSTTAREIMTLGGSKMRIIGVVQGRIRVTAASNSVELIKGQFCLIPNSVPSCELSIETDTTFLLTEPGQG